ncbi:hypothetical protein [Nocardia sp. NPDC058633]|uniref:hypothetical protein n=1 Tax=Nocardia sp. NPDC058633 TaxID=3346568 RepID=UPI00365305A3
MARQGKKVSTGQLHTLEIEVTSAAVPLRVLLAYSDFPGETLVNNLNLVVRGPDGTPRVGNTREGAGLDKQRRGRRSRHTHSRGETFPVHPHAAATSRGTLDLSRVSSSIMRAAPAPTGRTQRRFQTYKPWV